MFKRLVSPLPLMLALAVTVAASPVDAQGRGNDKGNGNGKAKSGEVRRGNQEERPALQRRDSDDDRYDDRNGTYDDGYYVRTDRQRANVKRGWCQGKGNPHNTVENCGYQSSRNRSGYDGRGGSYEQNHAEFHRYLDDRYRQLSAERGLDIRRQLELRAQKSAEHNRWHDQAGRRHDSL
ncbi:MAG: hypothetical protein KY464_04135 [Gemmatimonadetes bacterium]|nr:hypothetical protein [Gemmatimonadota bacterium]